MVDASSSPPDDDAIPAYFAYTVRAIITSVLSASLSCISSIFVMVFILRSQSKLHRPYHQIMFFVSFWDTVSSIAIALTTLPMPADVHQVYDFAGLAFGTPSTCQIQAFLIVIGCGFAICSNCVLNLYYVLTISFNMREQTFSRLVLPVCLVVAALGVIGLPSMMLGGHLLNPVPSYPYCLVGIYPPVQAQVQVTPPPPTTTTLTGMDTSSPSDYTNTTSSMEESSPPMRSQQHTQVLEDNDSMKTFDSLLVTILITAMVIILCSMLLVTLAVFKVEKQARRDSLERGRSRSGSGSRSDSNINLNSNSNSSPNPFARTRATLRQALMYIGAFILTWGWVGVTMAIPVTSSFWDFFETEALWYIPDQLKFIFMPLQGFFNASIFIYSKVYILRQSESSSPSSSSSSLTVWQAIKRVIMSPKSIPDILVSRIDIVMEDPEGNNTNDGGGGGRHLVRRGILVRRVEARGKPTVFVQVVLVRNRNYN